MVKNLPAMAGDSGLIPGLGSSPGEGNGYSLQYSCLGNPEDREDWWAPDGTEKRRSGSSYLSKTVLSSEFSFSDFCLHYWPPFALLSGYFLNPYNPFLFSRYLEPSCSLSPSSKGSTQDTHSHSGVRLIMMIITIAECHYYRKLIRMITVITEQPREVR